MRDDKELVESFLGPIRECAEYRPAFEHSDSAGVDLQGFLDLYGGDPFYAWIGLDTPLTGTLADDARTSTFAFFKHVVGYDLVAFFERNSVAIKSEVRKIVQGLLGADQ